MSPALTPLSRIQLGAISLVTVFVVSALLYRLLGEYDWIEAVWLVVITISTVGFSEHSELPPTLQLVTIGLVLFGVSAGAYTVGGFIQLALAGEVDRALGRRKMTKELSRLKNHVIVCGFGRLGQDLAHQLSHRKIDFVVVDENPDKVLLATDSDWLAIAGDATLETTLESVNLAHARALVSALPSDAENVFITLTARNLCPKLMIIAKSEEESSCRKLRQAGADKIVMPHRVGAQQMERMISRPSTADLFELFAEASHLEMELDEFLIADQHVFNGQTIGQSALKEKFNLLVVAIKDAQGEFRFNPSSNEVISGNDTLLVIGTLDNIQRLKTSCDLC